MGRMEVSGSVHRQGQLKVFFTQVINPMSGKSLATLVDEQAITIARFRFDAVVGNILLEELNRLGPKLYETIAVPLTKDGQGFLLRIKIVEIECGYLAGPGAGVKE